MSEAEEKRIKTTINWSAASIVLAIVIQASVGIWYARGVVAAQEGTAKDVTDIKQRIEPLALLPQRVEALERQAIKQESISESIIRVDERTRQMSQDIAELKKQAGNR